MNGTVQPYRVLAAAPDGAGDDEFMKETLLRAGALGCVFHEETSLPSIWPRLIGGEQREQTLSRFCVILPDTRIMSNTLYHPRREALLRTLRGLVPYLDKFEQEDREQRKALHGGM